MRSQRTVLIDSPTPTYLVGALGIEPSQPTGNSFTDRPPSLEEYAPIFGTQDRTCTCTLSPMILSHSCLLISSLGRIWCPGPESNRYAFRRGIFLLLYVTIATSLCCSLEHIITILFLTQVSGLCSLRIYNYKLIQFGIVLMYSDQGIHRVSQILL